MTSRDAILIREYIVYILAFSRGAVITVFLLVDARSIAAIFNYSERHATSTISARLYIVKTQLKYIYNMAVVPVHIYI